MGYIMKQCMDADNLHSRLRKIAGQINAIDKMVDEDVPCDEIIVQINAAKSALQKVGQIITEGHMNHCIRDMVENSSIVLSTSPCSTMSLMQWFM